MLRTAIASGEEMGIDDHYILSTILGLIHERSEMLFRPKERADYPIKLLGDFSKIEIALRYVGIPESEVYPVMISLFDVTIA